jgi:hypothetical protein
MSCRDSNFDACRAVACAIALCCWIPSDGAIADDAPRTASTLADGLIAHWPLDGDGTNLVDGGPEAVPHGVLFTAQSPRGTAAAAFNGRDAWLEVSASEAGLTGEENFSISVWVRASDATDDVPGDIISRYDAAARTGFHLGIKTSSVTTSQANFRQLQFGIDANHASEWVARGRPGNALLAFALCEHNGDLYAGTCEPGPDEAGHVYRLDEDNGWTDLGTLDGSNSVTALAVFEGRLYAATGKYRVAGSALPESENQTLGGRIFRLEETGEWTECGQLSGVEAVACLVVYDGQLYASSLYAPAAFFRYDGDNAWTECGVPDGTRVEAMAVYNGHLYATSYDRGHVSRFDGENWTDCGQLGDAAENTQTYSLSVYEGRLYCGTWRSGRVYRFEDVGEWTDVGRLGEELEVMGMLVHNGRLIAGTLPLAEVYQYDGGDTWSRLTQLDETPDVRYRRAWTMAEHRGEVYCSTLPSGQVYSWQAGRLATSRREFPSGWHHVAAVKTDGRLELYIDGALDSVSEEFDAAAYRLDAETSLRIGSGPNDFFAGELSDLRIYRRSLNESEIQSLAEGLEAD